MSEIQVGDMVRIARHLDEPNPIFDRVHFAIGTMHIVKQVFSEDGFDWVGILDPDKDVYGIRLEEVEKV